MPIVTTSNLVEELQQLQLLGPVYESELTTVLAGRFPDARSLAKELVRRTWLTHYQANQLFAGRGRELILGQYVLLEKLGEGGMGQVYKARHRLLKRIDAVKVIRPERLADPANRERFHREMEAAARLRHPNLVTVYNADQVGNVQYLAMEYLEGTDLGKLIKAQPQGLPVGQACDIYGNAQRGVDVQEQGDPTFKGCKIHDNKRAGVLSADSGKGTFVDCDIYGHPHPGVVSQDKGNPTLRGCRIKRNAKVGVAVIKESEATVQDCDLRDNLLGAFSVEKGSTLHRANNQE
jgi:hypothetical protein